MYIYIYMYMYITGVHLGGEISFVCIFVFYMYSMPPHIIQNISCILMQVIQAGMFDQKSTTSERKAFLEALLEEEATEEEVRGHSLMTRVCFQRR